MLPAASTATRVLEEHSDLSGASLGKIISTAVVLGMVHVLTGPDHLSAIAAMTTGSSWKSFSLGVRWGCGHSLGLLIMTAIFFAAGQTVDLNAVGAYLNYVVGAFMIILGAWTAVNIRKKHLQKVKELDELPTSPNMLKSPDCRSPMGELTATSGSLGHLAPISPAEVAHELTRSPASSFHLFIQSADGHEHTHHLSRLSVVESVDLEPGKPDKTRAKCCSNVSFENPWVQKITALAVGVVHGIAGPGGILGVLPAVVLNNWLKSTAYLASFCLASIVTMGGFAALYGEVTGRLGGSSLVMDLRVGLVSASFSFVVGIAWIVLQATGLMSVIFGE